MSPHYQITKPLFEAGLQCARRQHLMAEGSVAPDPESASREAFARVGQEIRQLARSAFPHGVPILGEGAQAAHATRQHLAQAPGPIALFDPVFRHDDLEARCDILLGTGTGTVDLLEVKAGSRVTPRYLMDLAYQVHVLEASGLEVGRCEVLHLDPSYRYQGDQHPIQELFRNSDVTRRVRNRLTAVEARLETMRRQLADPATKDIPTGPWCQLPFACPYLGHCTKDEPEMPLRWIPGLDANLARSLQQRGIDSMAQIPGDEPALTDTQRRAIEAHRENRLVCDPIVRSELSGLERPLHCVSILYALDILPHLPDARSWQHIPFAWADHTLHEDGSVTTASWVASSKGDPRNEFAESLAERLAGPGALILYSAHHERRLRQLVDSMTDGKAALRSILSGTWLGLDHLLESGAHHPAMKDGMELETVAAAFGTTVANDDPDLRSLEDTTAAWRRIAAPRTRASTRERLTPAIDAYALSRSKATMEIVQRLLQSS